MSRSEAKTKTTKRRKVWVNIYGSGQPYAHLSHKEAKRTHAALVTDEFQSEAAVPFIESRPGDVVLSREDVARALALLDEVGGAYSDGQEKHAIRTLFRGGR